jgi:hypothetical protein
VDALLGLFDLASWRQFFLPFNAEVRDRKRLQLLSSYVTAWFCGDRRSAPPFLS